MNAQSLLTAQFDYHRPYFSHMEDFCKQFDDLTEYVRQYGHLSPERQVIFNKAKDAMAHFQKHIEEMEKRISER